MKIRTEINDKELLPLKIISVAMMMGVLIFLGVTMLLSFTTEPKAVELSKDMPIEYILTFMTVGMAIALNGISPLMQKSLLKANLMKNPDKPVAALQASLILRIAMSEGIALFGVVTMLIAGLGGNFSALIWLNLFPVFILIFVVLSQFPSKGTYEMKLERLQREFDNY